MVHGDFQGAERVVALPTAIAPSSLQPAASSLFLHLGAWHDPPARQPAPGAPGPYTYEPCDDVDPTPDYENVLID